MENIIEIMLMDNNNRLLSDSELDFVAKRFKILSEPSRLKILRSLFDCEKSVTDIIESTGLLQANVSKQLRILQDNGIVGCRPDGLMRYYRLTDFTVQKICHAVCGRVNN
jgi:DNA-binding transcriptional ArsR family regulator